MASTTYTYSIENDFPNHAVNSDTLREQVLAAAITSALDRIDTADGDCLIVFRWELSNEEKTLLDGVVAVHDGAANVTSLQPVRVQNYTKPGRRLCVVGRRQVATLNTTSELDIAFAEEREIQGVKVEVANGAPGDWMEFLAEAPLGPGGSMVTLVQWTDTIYVPPSGVLNFDSDDSQTLPAGVTLCLQYHSTVNSGSQPEVYVFLKTWK
jgi:hypothetical protein